VKHTGRFIGAGLLGVALFGGAATTTLSGAGCVTEADRAPRDVACPSEVDWPIVSQVLEKSCGTQDCHGAPARPLRLYGRNGVRLSKDSIVGQGATTADELAQNRDSVCGLEPELMAAVVTGDGDVDTLTVTRKPRLLEAHKGGRVWLDASPGWTCFQSWLDGAVDQAACEADLQLP